MEELTLILLDIKALGILPNTEASAVPPSCASKNQTGKCFPITTFRRLIAHTRLTLSFLSLRIVVCFRGTTPSPMRGLLREGQVNSMAGQETWQEAPGVMQDARVHRGYVPAFPKSQDCVPIQD